MTIAGYELGRLFERGVINDHGMSVAADSARAWSWYKKAADVGEPNALARLAERSDSAAGSAASFAQENAYWLESSKYYAAASERARMEDWPDQAWINWRYRRASLARLLAREGSMQQVADINDGVHLRYAPPASLWKRVTWFVGIDD